MDKKEVQILKIDLNKYPRLSASGIAEFFGEDYRYVEINAKPGDVFTRWSKVVLKVNNFHVVVDTHSEIVRVIADVSPVKRTWSSLPENWETTHEIQMVEWVNGIILKLILIEKEKSACVKKSGRKSAKGAGTSTRKNRTNTATCSKTPQPDTAPKTLF